MKLLLTLILFTALILSSNAQTFDKNIKGTWKLIEIMIDPGDGSGKFHEVKSEKYLEIKSDGFIESNGNLCKLSKESMKTTNGQLIQIEDKITLQGCQEHFKVSYKFKNDLLFVYYPCKEGCAEKYEKIE